MNKIDPNQIEEINNSLYQRAISIIAQKQAASVSLLQRHLDIGFDEAKDLIDAIENDGLIGKADGIHKRQVFVNDIGENDANR